jgi:cholesterol oxidase
MWDFVIVGSGFGGSVSALRLAERGYRVLVVEKGRRYAADDFPKSNWDLRRWMWMPAAGLRGIFQMSFLKHVTVLHGVGVGGGSLVYANTLPTPKREFFEAPSWSSLADWQKELVPHYATARRMLGSTPNPRVTRGDEILRDIAEEMGRAEHFHPTEVAVFFGEPGKKVADPYFDGRGPDRVGCTHCGACMTGCRVGAKNTLDMNYLHLAERMGVKIRAETEVESVRPQGDGYALELRGSFSDERETITTKRVVFAGGVMGTVPLLLRMQADDSCLPRLSARLGQYVRTNSEALFACVSPNPDDDYSKGVAITSILHTDEHSHIEPVRYAEGSGFFRLMALPHMPGSNALSRIAGALGTMISNPLTWARALGVRDFARQSQILLYMRTLEGTLTLAMGRSVFTAWRQGLVSKLDGDSPAPAAFMKEATELARRFAAKMGGVPVSMLTETILGVPTTAHILGGCSMGDSADTGVIDHRHRLFGYDGLYVIDGSAMSANPGVNPSLTITALAERAMSFIEPKPS